MQTSLSRFFAKKIYDFIDLTQENIITIPDVQINETIEVETVQVQCKENGKKKRQCPFYKKIPGTSFTMDAFTYGEIPGCTAYFLSHFHADHYGGLRKSFKHKLYCSEITANLIKLKIGVSSNHIVALPMNTPITVQDVEVILIDANLCPGGAVFLFKVPRNVHNTTFSSYRIPNKELNIVHTGDFRAHPSMLHKMPMQVDYLFLDTTYLNPKHTFPSQGEIIQRIGNIVFEAVFNLGKDCNFIRPSKRKKENPTNQCTLSFGQGIKTREAAAISPFRITPDDKILIAIGSYTIGKEKIALYLAELLECKIYLNPSKTAIWKCFDSLRINEFISDDIDSQVHVLKMNEINYSSLARHLSITSYTKIIGIMPTGWTFGEDSWAPTSVSETVCIYSIPYSEHSSYNELKDFTSRSNATKVHPTVNMSRVEEQMDYIKSWKKDESPWIVENDMFNGKSIV